MAEEDKLQDIYTYLKFGAVFKSRGFTRRGYPQTIRQVYSELKSFSGFAMWLKGLSSKGRS